MLEPIPGFRMWHTERSGGDKGGGGLTMVYREDMTAHQWTPPVPAHLQYISNERQWLLLGRKVAFLHIYVACQTSRNNDFVEWNEHLFELVTQEAISLRRQGMCCLAMGDFNTRLGAIPGLEGNLVDRNRNAPMFLSFVEQINLTIINTLPLAKGLFTRFMDSGPSAGTKSLLDYGLIDSDHVNTVTSFIIDEEARFGCGSDHALLECCIQLGASPSVHWAYSEAIHYNITASTDFTNYKDSLDAAMSSIPLHMFSKLPVQDMLPHISENVNKSARDNIGIKVRKGRRGRKLPPQLVNTIRRKNRLSNQLANERAALNSEQVAMKEEQVRQLKDDIRDAIATIKLKRRQTLRSKTLRADPSRRKFWRFLKSQIKSAGVITATYDCSGQMVFEQSEIEEAILSHFSKIFKAQRVPIYPVSPHLPSQADLAMSEMEAIINNDLPSFPSNLFEEDICSPYTFIELEKELLGLKDGKASGYDQIPNELLKNTGFKFRMYLQTFLNKVMEEGHVPSDLNVGKCMLVHKVRFYCHNPTLTPTESNLLFVS